MCGMDPITVVLIALAALLLGAAAGYPLGRMHARSSYADRLVRAETTAELLRTRTEDLEADARLAGELTAAVGPLSSDVRSLSQLVTGQDRQRVDQLARLDEQIGALAKQSERLERSAAGLRTALTATGSRGRWGELQLMRIVEVAGMLDRVDYDAQASATTRDGRTVRPDLVVRLPGGASLVVDAKAPIAGMGGRAHDEESAARADDPRAQAAAVRRHIAELSKKSYWEAFSPAPQFVVCFLPSDGLLSSAASADPALVEDALSSGVVLASPSTLLAVLRTAALSWQQADLSASAQRILDLGRELHTRAGTLIDHVHRVGAGLDRTVGDYNRLVGSFDSRFMPAARRLAETGFGGPGSDSPDPLSARTRRSVESAPSADSLRDGGAPAGEPAGSADRSPAAAQHPADAQHPGADAVSSEPGRQPGALR